MCRRSRGRKQLKPQIPEKGGGSRGSHFPQVIEQGDRGGKTEGGEGGKIKKKEAGFALKKTGEGIKTW